MKKFLLLLLLLLSSCATGLSLTSCSHTRYIPMPEVHQRDSLSKSVNVLVNTTYVDRTHTLVQRGDTIFKVDSIYVERFTDVEVHDTVVVSRTDTITIRENVLCPSRRKPLSPFHRGDAPRVYRYSLWFTILAIVLFIFYVFLRLYLHR